VVAVVLTKNRNTGQSCVAANRFIVQRGIHDEFVTKLAARLDALTIGDGLAEPTPDVGPMIDAKGVYAVNDIVADAVERGAREATAVRDVPDGGNFVRPMLFTHVPDDARLAQEEVFGPVAGVFPF